jgi:hypothetical protein
LVKGIHKSIAGMQVLSPTAFEIDGRVGRESEINAAKSSRLNKEQGVCTQTFYFYIFFYYDVLIYITEPRIV